MINGRVHKAGRKEYTGPREQLDHHAIVEDSDFPQVEKNMQKTY